ncbi:predicted protein [Histoplasma capsulatum G186AR]|uniref:Uncharacterized protein n=2 Tax=Ajellomyces capsulatus TaxID=5037 RepID=C0NMP0_AJECG|nr:uncharacterized protein HCBG_04017 [Histoplasma capsulatum G186AR]EEH07138.1 predicted protein [Histoplasma capsulatum G186AR]KAG5287845.1 hypothetical protein I7I52_11754 [Histoplasma capsulatum]QSS70339.1 hypothetical protein I7I50_11934 [Histoplasma capsulatum G186AR]
MVYYYDLTTPANNTGSSPGNAALKEKHMDSFSTSSPNLTPTSKSFYHAILHKLLQGIDQCPDAGLPAARLLRLRERQLHGSLVVNNSGNRANWTKANGRMEVD